MFGVNWRIISPENFLVFLRETSLSEYIRLSSELFILPTLPVPALNKGLTRNKPSLFVMPLRVILSGRSNICLYIANIFVF